MPSIYCSFLIALSRITTEMLHVHVERRHLCLVPDLWGKALSLLPLRIIVSCRFSKDSFNHTKEVLYFLIN